MSSEIYRPRAFLFCAIAAGIFATAIVTLMMFGMGLRNFGIVTCVYGLVLAVGGIFSTPIETAKARQINPRLKMYSPPLFYFAVFVTLGLLITVILMLVTGQTFDDHTFVLTLLFLGISIVSLLASLSKDDLSPSTEESLDSSIRSIQRLND